MLVGLATTVAAAVLGLRVRRKRDFNARLEAAAGEFQTHGFTVFRQLMVLQDLAELQNQLAAYITNVVPEKDDSEAFYDTKKDPASLKFIGPLNETAYFCNIVHHPRWIALAEALIGGRVLSHNDSGEFFNKSPKHSKQTPPHQDNFYFQMQPCDVVTKWMALDFVDRHNGALSYISGSHKEGLRQHSASHILGFSQSISDYSPSDRAREVLVEDLQPGDVVAHHGLTIHSAGRNLTKDRSRRAFAMVFRGIDCKRDEEEFSNYMASLAQQRAQIESVL